MLFMHPPFLLRSKVESKDLRDVAWHRARSQLTGKKHLAH